MLKSQRERRVSYKATKAEQKEETTYELKGGCRVVFIHYGGKVLVSMENFAR